MNSKILASGAMARRTFIGGLGTFALAGCTTMETQPVQVVQTETPRLVPPPMYYAMPNEMFPIPEVDVSKVDPKWWRTSVDYPTDEVIGTVVVDTPNRYLYHIQAYGRATRYGVGVGRDGFSWAGRGRHIAYKREWPRWNPPDEMVARQPELEPVSIANGGMGPGLRILLERARSISTRATGIPFIVFTAIRSSGQSVGPCHPDVSA